VLPSAAGHRHGLFSPKFDCTGCILDAEFSAPLFVVQLGFGLGVDLNPGGIDGSSGFGIAQIGEPGARCWTGSNCPDREA
jgi:hypothetical protein